MKKIALTAILNPILLFFIINIITTKYQDLTTPSYVKAIMWILLVISLLAEIYLDYLFFPKIQNNFIRSSVIIAEVVIYAYLFLKIYLHINPMYFT